MFIYNLLADSPLNSWYIPQVMFYQMIRLISELFNNIKRYNNIKTVPNPLSKI